MSADDCSIRTPADALADDSAQLVAAHGQGQLTPLDIDRVAQMAAQAAKLFIGERAHHEPAFGALVNLSAILSNTGRLDDLTPHALAVLAHPTTWPGRDAAWKDLLYNALLGAMDRSPPERVLQVLGLARRGALTGDPRIERFLALGGTTRDAGKAFANVGRWDLHGQLSPFIEPPPPPAPELPPLAARALLDARAAIFTDAVVFALSKPDHARALELAAGLRALLAAAPDALVAAQHAVALECLLDANTSEPFLPPVEVGKLADEQMALVARWPGEREVARAFTSSAGTLLLLLNAARDAQRTSRAIELMAALTRNFPGDEELHFNSGRALVNAAIVRVKEIEPQSVWQRVTRLFGPTDPVLDLLEVSLQKLVATCRGSAQLAEARQRFEGATGRVLPPPKWSLPPAPPLHPDVERVKTAYRSLVEKGHNAEDDAVISAVIGTGAYLPRATLEGPSVYAREERYFVTLLEEIHREAAADSIRYWRTREVQLEALTRHLVHQGTEPIAIAAGAVRALYRMAPVQRKAPPVPENHGGHPDHDHAHGPGHGHGPAHGSAAAAPHVHGDSCRH